MPARSVHVVSLAAATCCLALFTSMAAADTVTRGQTGADTVCIIGSDFVAV